MQFQSDMLGVPVERPQVSETTALGAAYLAGLAVGYWESREEISSLWSIERDFQPALLKERRKPCTKDGRPPLRLPKHSNKPDYQGQWIC